MAANKIMVVDDSPTDLAFIEGIVNKSGCEVILVGSGEAAIRRAKIDQPDLIVMDLVMPGINGFEATRQLSREEFTKHIPIIICTNRNQETDKIWKFWKFWSFPTKADRSIFTAVNFDLSDQQCSCVFDAMCF